MTCPTCGSTMNHHADKLDDTDAATGDQDLGGVMKEVHTCAGCGNVETKTSLMTADRG